jgi:hypothetical protein
MLCSSSRIVATFSHLERPKLKAPSIRFPVLRSPRAVKTALEKHCIRINELEQRIAKIGSRPKIDPIGQGLGGLNLIEFRGIAGKQQAIRSAGLDYETVNVRPGV